MPCHAAIAEKTLVFSPDMNVEKALKELKKKKQRHAAVVDDTGALLGIFSFGCLLGNIMPVSVAIQDGISIDLPVRAAPGVAKRLRKLFPLTVQELMERKNITIVFPETPIWECVNRLTSSGGPAIVVDKDNGKYLGLIEELSVLEELQRMLEGED
ncbi:MAG: CBS domain-containing protein [Micavibrio sp.]|nr:CBS domain-containing protein [Micavibrio sp.]